MTCPSSSTAAFSLPDHLASVVWRGHAMGGTQHLVIPSGHPLLDAELPGGGWPCQAMTELLVTQNAQAEWRLLSAALARLTRQGGTVLLIGAPHAPHLPSLWREGLQDDRLARIDAHTPAERLWATEQALKARCVCAVLSWLPQARQEDIRRLQAQAAQHPGLFFVFRPARLQADSSAAPLRLRLGLGPYPHPLQVEILKRRGPMLDRTLSLAHWPQGLASLLPPTRPSQATVPGARTPRPSRLPEEALEASAISPSHHAALDGLAAGRSSLS